MLTQLTSSRAESSIQEGDIKLAEVKEIVMRARSASAPGPSGITYRVYKYCPRLLRRLWRLIRLIWKSKTIPNSWTLAEGCFVPKERNAKSLDQFREISLLDVEGKIFWAVVAKRLTLYLLENEFVDTSVQKGGVPGILWVLGTYSSHHLTRQGRKIYQWSGWI